MFVTRNLKWKIETKLSFYQYLWLNYWILLDFSTLNHIQFVVVLAFCYSSVFHTIFN
jgi:hypothetical protein